MNPRNPLILCVDDEEANLKLLKKLLVPRGYAVVSAANGKDALLKIKSQAIDLVLLDIIMPGMDGFEVCRQIKEDPKLKSIPVIMVTALTDKKDRIRGIEAGAEEFLSKPFDLAEVLARIMILLKMKKFDDERQHAESQREAALEALKKSHAELEYKVQERTSELAKANEMLQADISERERAQEALQVSEKKLNEAQALGQIGNWEFDIKTQKITWSKQVYTLYERDPVLGTPTVEEEALYYSPEQAKTLHGYTRNAIEAGQFFEYDLQSTLPSGKQVYLTARMRPIKDAQGRVIKLFGVVQDITERKQAEEVILSQLAEKEVLLKEVHHRVKNNLMTIIGLIKMQETKANNDMFTSLLLELESRVHSMVLVHESIYKSADLAHVDLQNYIETLTAHIRSQFGAERDIRFRVQAAGLDVGLAIAVPCGLILNELITNAYKHAFPGDKPCSGADHCEVAITVMHEGGILTLTVADNGIGLPAKTNWENPETLGLKLIKMLSQQIKGSIEMDCSAGTTIRLKFMVNRP